MSQKLFTSQVTLANGAAALSMVIALVSIPVWAKPDTGGRGLSERRVEMPTSRGRENAGGGTTKSGVAISQPLQDVRQKAQRGAAAVLGGQRRTFSGPTDRLKRVFNDRIGRVVTARRR